MSNYDVIITRAAKVQPFIADPKKALAVRALSQYLASGVGAFPTKAQQNTQVSAAAVAFAGLPNGMMEAVDTAIWWQAAVNNSSLFDVSLNTMLTNSTVFAALDMHTLNKLSLFLAGKALTVLT